MQAKAHEKAHHDCGEYQDQQRRQHRPVRADGKGDDDRHAHQDKAPSDDVVDVDGNGDGRTAVGQEQAKQGRGKDRGQQHQYP